MGRQRSCTNLWRWFPPDPAKMGRASGYISGRFAIGSSDFFSFSDDDFVYTDPEAYSPLTRLAAGPSDLDLLGWSAFSTRPSIAEVPVPFAAAIRRLSRKSLKEQIGVLMPRRYCGSCRSPLHADDGHSECVSCLGKSHADAALAGSDCSHCESISIASLRSRIAFFSENDPAPRALPFSSSQGPVRKKHREVSPVLFSQPDQRPCKRERSGLVRGKWRWAGRWQHVTGSFRCWGAVGLSDWPRPLRFARAQRRQSRDGCRTFPCPLKSGWRAGFGVVSTRGALSQPSGWVVSAGAPSGPSATTIAVLPWSSRRAHEILVLPLLCPPPYFRFIRPHYDWRHWRKGIWEDASTGWVSGCTSLPTHCHRLEGEGQSPVQAMQDHFSARWTLLRFSWTGGFGAPLYGGSPGLSGQAPLCRRWVWAWSCDSQGAEKRNGPGFASHQDYRPSHRKVYGQPGSARAPPVAHADGDQGRGQGLLPWCSNFPQRPLWTCGGRIRWALHRGTEGVTGYATLPAQALQPSQTPPPSEAPGPPTQDSVGPCASGVLLICRTGRGEGRVPPRPDRPPKGLSWETSWHPVFFRVQRELCLLLQGPYKRPCNRPLR